MPEELKRVPYFTIEGYKSISGLENDNSARVYLYRLVKRGEVLRLKRGIYMAEEFYKRHLNNPKFSPFVSHIINPYSYTSMIYELQHYGLLTEATYPITGVTFKQERQISNTLGEFVYKRVPKTHYHGYFTDILVGIPFHRATVAKAMFDYFYFLKNPRLDLDIIDDLRLNMDMLECKDKEQFRDFVFGSNSRKLRQIYRNIKENGWLH